jgi:anti-anti-sigma regulatory factor
MTAFSANVRRTNGSTRLELAGDLDLCAHATVRDAYRSALATSRSGLIMNLSALKFCDLTGQLLRCRAGGSMPASAVLQPV